MFPSSGKYRLILIAILCGSLLFSGCFQIRVKDDSSPGGDEYPVIEVDPNHQICQQTEDCTMTYLDCSACDCGVPINLSYELLYQELYQEQCSSYSGPVCEMFCPPASLTCQSGICTVEPSE